MHDNNRVLRVYFEKQVGHDFEAKNYYNEFVNVLGVSGLETVRVLERYDIEGVKNEEFKRYVENLLFEPLVDILYYEDFERANEDLCFAVEYMPGQFDQGADSVKNCMRFLDGSASFGANLLVKTAKVYVLKGNVTAEEFTKIKGYCINQIECRETSFLKPETLVSEFGAARDVGIINGFINMSDGELAEYHLEASSAMSLEDLKLCRAYFKHQEERDPTVAEIKMIDAYWSDHCRHTTFLTSIENVSIEDGSYKDVISGAYDEYVETGKRLGRIGRSGQDINLMDIATMPMRKLRAEGLLDDLEISEEVNACSIEVDVDVKSASGIKAEAANEAVTKAASDIRVDINAANNDEEVKSENKAEKACDNCKSEKWLVMFKNETHNHPTEMEPLGGASTCLGGAIRDPMSGRAYVYQAMRVTGCADPRSPIENTLQGKLPQRRITTLAAEGYSSYGNQIGASTGHVCEIYDERYVAKRMELGAVIGAVPKGQVVRETPKSGDLIILLGGRTGRDGIGGATGSSKEQTEESLAQCGSEVQKGNPSEERKIVRLFRNPEVSRMIIKCNDFGAGGVSVAVGELARGLDIDLDAIPTKYDGLDGTELALSESQERMAIVIKAADKERFVRLSAKENLEATVIAVVTDRDRIRMKWRDKYIVDIARDFLDTNGVKQTTDVIVTNPTRMGCLPGAPIREGQTTKQASPESASTATREQASDAMTDKAPGAPIREGQTAEQASPDDASTATREQASLDGASTATHEQASSDISEMRRLWYKNLSSLRVCSQKGLAERFDSTAGGCTVLMPFGGKHQNTPVDGMAAKIPVEQGKTDTATLMTFGFDPVISVWSPFHGAVYAVLESVSKIAAMGGDTDRIKLTFQEFFEKPGTDPRRWGKPFAALLGAFYAQSRLNIASVGGKDSMSGSFKDIDVPPTLVSFAVTTANASKVISPEFKRAGSRIVLLKAAYDENNMPDFARIRAGYKWLLSEIRRGRVVSAMAVKCGGVSEAVSKMCFGNMLGVAFDSDFDTKLLFEPLYGSILLEMREEGGAGKERDMREAGKECDMHEAREEREGLGAGKERDMREVHEANEAREANEVREEDEAREEGNSLFDIVKVGTVVSASEISVAGTKISLCEALETWMKPLSGVFPTAAHAASVERLDVATPTPTVSERITFAAQTSYKGKCSSVSYAPDFIKPKALILVSTGVTGEYECKKAFEKAGAKAEVFVIKSMTPEDIECSMIRLAIAIRESNIIVLPGGAGAKGEPGGAGKFAAGILLKPRIKEAILEHLNVHDGLIFGVGSGFQSLLKSTLLPYGEYTPPSIESPTYVLTSCGSFMSQVVNYVVNDVSSPWLSLLESGQICTDPVAHSEGRFFASANGLDILVKNRQIVTQYVDLENKPSMEASYNPFGSLMAIEGITSPDGRIFGKMGHIERNGCDIIKNVEGYGAGSSMIFKSGVRYFS